MSSRPSRLAFRADRTFTIVQLTDVHWTDGGADDARSRELIETVLDAERPDLVALTGDIVSGDTARDPGEAYRQAVFPIEDRRIPWAAAFGNHDDEGPLGRAELLAVQQAHACCLSERGPDGVTGVGNYVLTVASPQDGALAAALYFLDSGAYAPDGPGDYAWIARDQIAWYVAASRALAEAHARAGRTGRLPALAFFHIPLPEYEEVWASAPCRGHRQEAACRPALNSGLFAALVERGDVMGTFVGHDHLNDYEGELHGVRLCYGRASGYGGYGRDGFPRGARVVRLREGQRSFETWIRTADGSVPASPPEHAPDAWTAREG